MPIPTKIIKFLDGAKTKYETVKHRIVYTAGDKAATLKLPEKVIGKTLAVKTGKSHALVLIPANKNLDKASLKKAINDFLKKAGEKTIKDVDFAQESWMKKNLKGIKLGATPPFGTLWKLFTLVDRSIFQNKKIIINSGDYQWSIKISPETLKKLIPGIIIGGFTKKK